MKPRRTAPKPKKTEAPTAPANVVPDIRESIQWKALTPEELRRMAEATLGELEQRAHRGEDEAAREFLSVAFSVGDSFTAKEIAKCEPLKTLITRCDRWPVNLPCGTKHQRALGKSLKQLGLGTECETNKQGQHESAIPVAVKQVFYLLRSSVCGPHRSPGTIIVFYGRTVDNVAWQEWGKANAKKVPARLTRKNAPEWGRLTVPLLEIIWGKRFEEHRDFAEYRKSAAYKKSGAARGQITETVNAGKLRDSIRKIWRKAWYSLANPRA